MARGHGLRRAPPPPPAPVIASLDPTSAGAGQQVTISGTGFGAAQGSGYVSFQDHGVNWGAPGDAATFKVNSWSGTQIVFTVPTPTRHGWWGQSWAVVPGTTATVMVTTSAGEHSASQPLAITGGSDHGGHGDQGGQGNGGQGNGGQGNGGQGNGGQVQQWSWASLWSWLAGWF